MKYYLGIDLGGTFIKGGVVDENGKIVVSDKVATEKEKGAEGVMDNVAALCDKLVSAAGLEKKDICGAGMGVPGTGSIRAVLLLKKNATSWV